MGEQQRHWPLPTAPELWRERVWAVVWTEDGLDSYQPWAMGAYKHTQRRIRRQKDREQKSSVFYHSSVHTLTGCPGSVESVAGPLAGHLSPYVLTAGRP